MLIATRLRLDGRRRAAAHAAQRHGDRGGRTASARSAAYGGGGRVAFDFFLEDERWKRFAGEAARQAILKLDAVDAPGRRR